MTADTPRRLPAAELSELDRRITAGYIGQLAVDSVLSDGMQDIILDDPPPGEGNPVLIGEIDGDEESYLSSVKAEQLARMLVALNNAARPLIDEVRELRSQQAQLLKDRQSLIETVEKERQNRFACAAEWEKENARLQEELKLWRPLTPEEAEEAYANAEAAPMSEEEISRIMEKVLDPAYSAPSNEAAQMAVEIERLRADLATLREYARHQPSCGSRYEHADLPCDCGWAELEAAKEKGA